ncbi:hypothetical protein [Parabacteroides sp. AM08-6]|uniref:hypothetical protein n=1 Tax=Parabacteroides sp. AM08-6 TaxID=2292053 RepID=UPI000EFE7599|nr:hypothetical protein [Parabacteroides sp. AM08-6]RHJ74988.1 hypothetical protein DW103_17755 [Parabacteroides sp. AM08-6]
MNRLKAEEARKIANDNSALIQEKLDEIYRLIEQAAKEGYFQVNYVSEISDASLINPIKDQLSEMGYNVSSFSLKDINLAIKW